MKKFDYSFLNNGLLPAKLITLTSSIASLKNVEDEGISPFFIHKIILMTRGRAVGSSSGS